MPSEKRTTHLGAAVHVIGAGDRVDIATERDGVDDDVHNLASGLCCVTSSNILWTGPTSGGGLGRGVAEDQAMAGLTLMRSPSVMAMVN